MKYLAALFLFLMVVFLVYSYFMYFEYDLSGNVYTVDRFTDSQSRIIVNGIGIGINEARYYSEFLFTPKILFLIFVSLLYIIIFLQNEGSKNINISSLNLTFFFTNISAAAIFITILNLSYSMQYYLYSTVMFFYIGFLFCFINIIIAHLLTKNKIILNDSIRKLIFYSIIFGSAFSIELGNHYIGFNGEGKIGSTDLNLINIINTEFPMQLPLPGYIVFRGLILYFLVSGFLSLITIRIEN